MHNKYPKDLLPAKRTRTPKILSQVRKIDNRGGVLITSYLVFDNTQNQDEFTEKNNFSSE